ncbi:unnamed protein product, partial [marine sediment metagenome]
FFLFMTFLKFSLSDHSINVVRKNKKGMEKVYNH